MQLGVNRLLDRPDDIRDSRWMELGEIKVERGMLGRKRFMRRSTRGRELLKGEGRVEARFHATRGLVDIRGKQSILSIVAADDKGVAAK